MKYPLRTGKTYLLTLSTSFIAPDKHEYNAVFGTITESSGFNTIIGSLQIDTNDINAAIQCNSITSKAVFGLNNTSTKIYNADKEETY